MGFAITSLVLGIISILTCWCYGIVGLILGVLAIVFSIIFSKKNDGRKHAVSVIGLICGIVGCVLSVIGLLLLVIGIVAPAMLHNISMSRYMSY